MMIKVTRLSGEEIIVNANLIQYVESKPDTYISLTTSDRLVVREPMEEIIRRCLEYSRSIRIIPGLGV